MARKGSRLEPGGGLFLDQEPRTSDHEPLAIDRSTAIDEFAKQYVLYGFVKLYGLAFGQYEAAWHFAARISVTNYTRQPSTVNRRLETIHKQCSGGGRGGALPETLCV